MSKRTISIFKKIILKIKSLFSGHAAGTRLSGTIKFFDRKKRFGFIIAGNQEYFFHVASTSPEDFKALQDGAPVSFTLIQGKKGPQADKIMVRKKA